MILAHLLYILSIDYDSVFLETVDKRLYTDMYPIIDVQSKFNIIIAIIYFLSNFYLLCKLFLY